MERIVNKNPRLYGPGPLARRPMSGLGARPPLQGLILCATQGIVFGLLGGYAYKWTLGDPGIKAMNDYYAENPSR